MKKNIIKKSMSFLLAASMALTSLTGIPATKAQAATAKPVIKCSKVKIKNNSCTVKVGQKVNLTAKSGKTNVTKKGTWKSSKKTVATISKTGKLTAKKAGNTNITITYKKKTSKKLKVVVKKKATTATPTPKPTDTAAPNPVESSKPDVTSSPTTTTKPVTGTQTVKYNPKGGKMVGSDVQTVQGEILTFPKVEAPEGKRFIGWYDASSGGNRIYESYVPTGTMELYAHYMKDDQKFQWVEFSLGCNYGDTYSFMGRGPAHGPEYDWVNKTFSTGPMRATDIDNVEWGHAFKVDDDGKFTLDSLPTPEVPGYTFEGWYDTPQIDRENIKNSKEVKVGDKLSEYKGDGEFRLYARFSKKITVSFDDFRGNRYDDIVVDSYKTIEECGKELPVPEIPGATFKGWAMDKENHGKLHQWDVPIVENSSFFMNCIERACYMCSGCGAMSLFSGGLGGNCKPDCDTNFRAVNDYWFCYEETDHVTLYPSYEYDELNITFDPAGGIYDQYSVDNANYLCENASGIIRPVPGATIWGSMPYGTLDVPLLDSLDDLVLHYGSGMSKLPKVDRDYYEFDAWYYKDDDGEEQEFTLKTILSHDLEVYAKWKPGKSRVIFSSGISTASIPADEKADVGLDLAGSYYVTTESTVSTEGKRLPISVDKEGRKFLGWFLYGTDDPFTEDTSVIGTVYVYGKWGPLPKELPIKLDFDPNGGTFDDSSFKNNISGLRGTAFTSFPSVSRDDYDFVGWYVLKPGATDYNNDKSFIKMATKPFSVTNDMVDDLGDDDDDNDKVTLVARWQEKGHAQSITMMSYNTDTYKTNAVENGETLDLQYDTTGEFLYQFRATVLPETIDNRNVIWSSSDPSVVYISGANDDGTYVTRNNAYLTRLKFADGVAPTREGYDVTLTARAADLASVTFTIKLHISFPEDQIPVTVNFIASEFGVFRDEIGEGFATKTFSKSRSVNIKSLIGNEKPELKPEIEEYWDSRGMPNFAFLGWEVQTASGVPCELTDDMKASDFNGLDVINVSAVWGD